MNPLQERRLGRLSNSARAYFTEASDDARRSALVEAAFLMAAADGDLGADEREELSGALAILCGGQLTDEQINGMLDQLIAVLADEGWEARIAAVSHALGDAQTRRNAFRLAAGISFIDGEVQDPEARLFGLFSEAFGIDNEEASQILVEVRDTMFKANPYDETVPWGPTRH